MGILHVFEGGDENIAQADNLQISQTRLRPEFGINAHILVAQMLEQLQLAVGSLGQDRSAEGLHDLLDRHRLVCELVLRRAAAASA
jgi:hypothetical protein